MAGISNLNVPVVLLFSFAILQTSGYFDPSRSSDAFGRRFIVTLPIEADTSIRMIHNIYVSSRSSEIVQVSVSRPNTSWTIPNVAIQPGIVANITLNMAGTLRIPFNPNGIPIQIESQHDIGVWVIPGRGDSVLGGYRAIPMEALAQHYVSVMYPSSAYSSEVILFNPLNESNEIKIYHQNTDMTITIDNVTSAVHAIPDIPNLFTIPKVDSAKISSSSDLSGLKISAAKAMWVTSGRNCSRSPQACNDLLEQPTPLGAWGQSFVIVPQITIGPSIMKLRIITAFLHTNTTVSTYTTSGLLMENWTLTEKAVFKDINVTQGRLFTIRANKPIMVTQFYTDKQRRLDYAAMSNIPPVEQFTNRTVVFPAQNDRIFNNTLVVITRCEHRKDILLNNKDISNNYSVSVNFNSMQNSSVHGTYCVFNTTLVSGSNPGSHTLKLRSNANIGAAYSAIVYGVGTKAAYAYQVASDLQEIVCGMEGGHVSLCEFYIPPDYITPSMNDTNNPTGGSEDTNNTNSHSHTIAVVIVLVILSSLAIIIVVIVVLGSCGKDKGPRVAWRRLQNTEMHYDPSYDEDNVEVDV
ncbi:uncharacterized protein LOC121409177 [Lytechinus variegatus]|uniref:uncharacterized protein LOC121409177 n=1 Tax=Lytechinus variegatus TaxID=7654 RepID=UPI001BB0F703|nr:uncharacterized protein LOC121409177 [Lytechinus variegatus]